MTGGSRAAQRRAKKRAREAPTDEASADAASEPAASSAPPESSSEPAAASALTEWTIPMPAADSDLGEAIELARAQASTISGRKYRYGACLLADDIVLRTSSNKTPFQRAEIHAEMAALKGCPRPAGKDVVLARLAPVKPAPADDDGEPGEAAAPAGKLLNARPCAACEFKMTQRGIARVFFTLNAREVGVMQLNPASGGLGARTEGSSR